MELGHTEKQLAPGPSGGIGPIERGQFGLRARWGCFQIGPLLTWGDNSMPSPSKMRPASGEGETIYSCGAYVGVGSR